MKVDDCFNKNLYCSLFPRISLFLLLKHDKQVAEIEKKKITHKPDFAHSLLPFICIPVTSTVRYCKSRSLHKANSNILNVILYTGLK